MLRRVNKGYYRTAYIVFYDKENDVLQSEPQRFRYKNLRKGDYRGNQVIAGWLQTDASKVIETDSYVLYNRAIDKGKLRGDKYLENTDKEEILTNQVKPELEMGAYDPIFGTKLAGTPTDVRSVDFIDVVSGGEYKFNLVGIEPKPTTNLFNGTYNATGGLTVTSATLNGLAYSKLRIFNPTALPKTQDLLPDISFNSSTQYTFIGNWLQSADAGDLRLFVKYTDGSDEEIGTPTLEDEGFYFVSAVGKTIDFVTYSWQDEPTSTYIRDFSIFSGAEPSDVINVLQFDVNGDTTSTIDIINFNQSLTLEEDTVKVKIWATDILLDSDDNIITDYALSLLKRKYKEIGEVIDFELADDEDLELCAIRGRRDMSKIILRLS